jgi:hypothetical protein
MLLSSEYLRFGFVRNPYSRLVSAWKSKLTWEDPQYVDLRAGIREACNYKAVNGNRVGKIGFRDAVSVMLAQPELFDDHWRRQVDVLMLGIIDYQVIGKFERFDQEFRGILRQLGAPGDVLAVAGRVFNPTKPISLASIYEPSLARQVYEHYLTDFEAFGYGENSWRPD